MRTVIKLLPLVLLVSSATARADRRNPLDGQPAIRDHIEMRKLRFEVTPMFIVSTNQDYKHAIGVGANLQFHITDWIGVGVEGAYTFNANTALENDVRGKLPPDPYMRPPQPTLTIHDQHVMGINALLAAYASLTPFAGKFSLFSALFFNYDLYVNLGVGMVNYVQNGCCSAAQDPMSPVGDPNLEDASQFAGLKVGGMFAVGAHVFFNDWIGIQLELHDYIVKANPGGFDTDGDRHLCSGQSGNSKYGSVCNGASDESLQNNLFFSLGVTIMLPPRAKVTH